MRETFPFGANEAEQEINNRNFADAQREIDLLAKADPDNYTLTILRSKLDAQRKTASQEQQQAQAALLAKQQAAAAPAAGGGGSSASSSSRPRRRLAAEENAPPSRAATRRRWRRRHTVRQPEPRRAGEGADPGCGVGQQASGALSRRPHSGVGSRAGSTCSSPSIPTAMSTNARSSMPSPSTCSIARPCARWIAGSSGLRCAMASRSP